MRLLLNNGLTGGELYTNIPKDIVNKSWRWWISYYGRGSTYEDSLAGPFEYALSLIFNKMIEDKVGFTLPNVPESYFDFEVVLDDKFVEHRQKGRFEDIDFIGSDFSGYAIRLYYKTYKYHSSRQVYIGGSLKKKFIERVNNGERFYSIKRLTIKDFLPQIFEKFNKLSKMTIKQLVVIGFRRLYTAVKHGCAISIKSIKDDCLFHIGNITTDPATRIRHYALTWSRKLRRIYRWKKLEYDGYCYLGLTNKMLEEWVEENRKSRLIAKFKRVMIYRIKEELFYRNKEVHIFRIKRKDFKKWIELLDYLEIKDIEYLGKSLDRKFYPSDLTWKQLIKTYEKGSN